MTTKDTEPQTLDEWRPNYKRKCLVCGREGTVQGVKNNKVVYRGDMCGVCTWGEANIGIAGFGAKVNPARENPYKNTAPQQAEPLTDEQRLGWYAWRVKDLEEKLANAQKQPQAEAVPWDRLPGHLIDKYEGEVLTEELLQTAVFEVLQAAPQQAEAVPGDVTDAMVDAYLKANDAYWRETDTQPKSPTKWRNGNPKEATRVSLAAAIAQQKGQP